MLGTFIGYGTKHHIKLLETHFQSKIVLEISPNK